MGLLSSYNDYNKVTHSALKVQYAVVPDTYEFVGWYGEEGKVSSWVTFNRPFYRVTRYATKSYSYVGMDEATALCCQNAKVSQYTRPYSRVTQVERKRHQWSSEMETVLSTDYTYECRSDIAAQHTDGCMWQVDINVNEEDEKFSYTLPADPSSLFTSENQRNYDQVTQQQSNVIWVPEELNSGGQ